MAIYEFMTLQPLWRQITFDQQAKGLPWSTSASSCEYDVILRVNILLSSTSSLHHMYIAILYYKYMYMIIATIFLGFSISFNRLMVFTAFNCMYSSCDISKFLNAIWEICFCSNSQQENTGKRIRIYEWQYKNFLRKSCSCLIRGILILI